MRRLELLCVLALLPLACGKGTSADPTATSASAGPGPSAPELPDFEPSAPSASAAPSAAASGSAEAPPDKPRAALRRSVAGELVTRARALELSDEQKSKLDASEGKLGGAPTDDEETKNAYKLFFAVLLDGVKTGQVLEHKLAPHYATLDRIARARATAEATALGDLHALLDEDQRKDLLAGLRKKYPTAAEKAAADAKVAKEGKVKKPNPAVEETRRADRTKRRNARVTKLLELDEKQQQRVSSVLIRFDTELRNRAQREARDRRMRALIAAFDKPAFTAAGLDLGRGPRSRMAERVGYINALLAILKVDQRDKLARTLERPTSKRWGAAIVGDTGPADDD